MVTATCVGSADEVLEGRRFRLCVIDEATQVICQALDNWRHLLHHEIWACILALVHDIGYIYMCVLHSRHLPEYVQCKSMEQCVDEVLLHLVFEYLLL